MRLRVPVDFNTMTQDEQRRIRINTSLDGDWVNYMREGLRIEVYDKDLEVEAILEIDQEYQEWLARTLLATYRDIQYPGH